MFLKILPHLPVKNLQATLDYYSDILGFREAWTLKGKDGGISRDGLGMLFSEDLSFTSDINNNSHKLPLIWFVDNIDAVYNEFHEKGIEIADELKTHPYGLREFAFIDINGYYIRIAEEARGSTQTMT